MIQEIVGNIWNTEADIVCFHVSCQGTSRDVIFSSLKDGQVPLEQFEVYNHFCENTPPEKLLGGVLYLETEGPLIACCFGADEKHLSGFHNYEISTNYPATRNCFLTVKEYAQKHDLHLIAIPAYIGCIVGGGYWKIIRDDIIADVFGKSDIHVKIVYNEINEDAHPLSSVYRSGWKDNDILICPHCYETLGTYAEENRSKFCKYCGGPIDVKKIEIKTSSRNG